MKLKLHTILAALVAITFATNVNAKITGKIVDSQDKSPLMEATLKLVKANRDSTFVNGATSDIDGNFTIPTVPAGKYVMKVTYLGYNGITKAITVPQSGNLALGEVPMTQSSYLLKEATVVGVKTPITVKEDTIEYNAGSFKTQVNAVVEDLLKRLPGVEVGTDGSITANGKTISKFLVDGKEFFADDPTVASKNLPANMIEKLQVIDRKSDLARLTGVDDGEDETVINLTVKKGMNQGWTGNVVAGYGTEKRYGARGMANYFQNGNQFSILGGANNTNNMGFSDGGAQRFQRGGGNNGINTSQNFGINFSVGDEEKLRTGGSVMYSHSDQDHKTQNATTTTFADFIRDTQSKTTSNTDRHNLRADFRLRWKVDSCNTIEFRPNMSMNFNNSWNNSLSYSHSGATLGSLAPINNSIEKDVDDGSSYEFGGQLVYNHNFKSRPGRSFSGQVRYQFSNRHEDNNSRTFNDYDDAEMADDDIAQLIKNHNWSNSINGRLTWTEPIGNVKNANFLQIAYRGSYRFNNSDKNVYDRKPDYFGSLLSDATLMNAVAEKFGFATLDNEYTLFQILDENYGVMDNIDTFNKSQSSQFRNEFFSQDIQVGYKKVHKMYNLDAGVQLMGTMQKSSDLLNPERNIATAWFWTPAPYARLKMKFTKTRNLSFNYRARANQPSVNQLQPVPNLSNPMRISVGNPDLKATFGHNVELRFNDFNQEQQRSWMLFANFDYTQNNVSSISITDKNTGKSASTYTNLNGNWSSRFGGMLSVPFRNRKFSLRNHLFAGYSRNKNYNIGGQSLNFEELVNAKSILAYISDDMINNINSFNVNVSPGLSFISDIVELDIRPTYGYQSSRNSLKKDADRNIHNYGGRFNGTIYLGDFVLNTDLAYTTTSGYDKGMNTKQCIWNASLEYKFLSGKNATIGIKGYDMLGQRKNINFSVNNGNTVQSWTNSLGRYFMASFSYRFQTFGKGAKVPESEFEQRRFGPPGGGPGGPGGGPGRGGW